MCINSALNKSQPETYNFGCGLTWRFPPDPAVQVNNERLPDQKLTRVWLTSGQRGLGGGRGSRNTELINWPPPKKKNQALKSSQPPEPSKPALNKSAALAAELDSAGFVGRAPSISNKIQFRSAAESGAKLSVQNWDARGYGDRRSGATACFTSHTCGRVINALCQ